MPIRRIDDRIDVNGTASPLVDGVARRLLERANVASGIYQMTGHLCDIALVRAAIGREELSMLMAIYHFVVVCSLFFDGVLSSTNGFFG